MNHSRRQAFLCAFVLSLHATSALAQVDVGPTSVTLTFSSAAQRPVSITRAQLLVTAWGVSEAHDLDVAGNTVRIDLEATRPEFIGKIADLQGYLYIKAAGHPPLISESLSWPTGQTPAFIDFRERRSVAVRRGENATLHVTLRESVPRRIRLVDEAGRPVAGAQIETAVYWNAPNHCGFLNGRDALSRGVTNAAGVLEVPDVDGMYAFSLLERHMVLTDADNFYPAGSGQQGLITSLSATETTLKVRRYQQRRLVIDVREKSKPVPNAVLWTDMGLGTCGAGYGPLATGDDRGRIHADEFYPEMWRDFWICAGGKQIWVMPEGSELPSRIDVGVTRSAAPNGYARVCRD